MIGYGPFLLHTKLSAVCPIDGVAIGDPIDTKTWRIDFAVGATPAQQAAAQMLLAAITPMAFAAADTTMLAAAAAIPDPLVAAKAQALASLKTTAVAG